MESLSRLSIFAAYVIIGCAVGITAWLGGMYYNVSSVESDEQIVDTDQDPSRASASGARNAPNRGVPVDYLITQKAQIESLQKLLKDKERLLEKKNQLLEEKTQKQLKLEAELSEAIGMLEMLATDFSKRSDQDPSGAKDGLANELGRLRNERNESALLAKRLKDDLDELKMELTFTDEQITELQQQSELETTVLLAEMQTFQSVASEAMAGLGENAVPGLIALLSDPRPRIRRWAAGVLGDIGSAASEALPALVETMNDDDQEVQQVVREALEKIQPSE